MDANHEIFRMYATAVAEMNTRRKRVIDAGADASSVAYHAAELVQHAAAADQAMKMVNAVLMTIEGDLPEMYRTAWELAKEGKRDEVSRLFSAAARD